MSVTAARLGSSPIRIDWSNISRIPTGSSSTARPAQVDAPALEEAWQKLKSRFESGEVGFYNAPMDNALSQAEESMAMANRIRESGKFTDVLFLGIGGSALGPISMFAALKEKMDDTFRFHFLENPDPMDWKSTIAELNPEKTLVCVVTKSGGTFETIAQTLLSLDWLGKDRWKSNVVAITDPAKGDLKAFTTENEIPTLHIMPSIGGRFSIFSPVGLFAAALAGLSVKDFLQGAKQIHDYCEKTSMEKNPLMILGSHCIAHYEQRPIHVCMPYSTRLRLIGDWFVQLWGESLGKDGKGFTPIAAVGATDQHSILQLLRDGPDDKITFFITVEKLGDEVKIPKDSGAGLRKYNAFSLLQGHSLQELLTTEYQATSKVLSARNRPTVTLQIESLDERNLGALYYAFSVLTAFTGTLWGVNPFDQPGVEEGKVYTKEALMRSEGESWDIESRGAESAVERLRRGPQERYSGPAPDESER